MLGAELSVELNKWEGTISAKEPPGTARPREGSQAQSSRAFPQVAVGECQEVLKVGPVFCLPSGANRSPGAQTRL